MTHSEEARQPQTTPQSEPQSQSAHSHQSDPPQPGSVTGSEPIATEGFDTGPEEAEYEPGFYHYRESWLSQVNATDRQSIALRILDRLGRFGQGTLWAIYELLSEDGFKRLARETNRIAGPEAMAQICSEA